MMRAVMRSLAGVSVLGMSAVSAQPTTFATYRTYGNGCAGSAPAYGADQIVPAAAATAFGNSNNNMPFSKRPERYQQVVLGAELPVTAPFLGIGLRRDEVATAMEGHSVEMEISLGPTTYDHNTITVVFANNFNVAGGPPQKVFSRRWLSLPSPGTTPPPTDPTDFFFNLPFDAAWNRPLGNGENLLVDISIHATTASKTYVLDSVVGGNTSRVSSCVTCLYGSVDVGYGLVLAFRTPGSNRVPCALYNSNLALLGEEFLFGLANAGPRASGALLLGLSELFSGPVLLPFHLGPLGAPGCWLLSSADVTLPVTANGGGDLSLTLRIPNNPYLRGLPLYLQFAMTDPSNALGFVTSNGAEVILGNR